MIFISREKHQIIVGSRWTLTVDQRKLSSLSFVGLIIIGCGLLYLIWQSFVLKKGIRTTGKIIDFHPDISSYAATQPTREFPVVEYLDVSGSRVQRRINDSNYIGKYRLGDELDLILYESNLHLPKNFLFKAIFVVGIGLAILLGSLV